MYSSTPPQFHPHNMLAGAEGSNIWRFPTLCLWVFHGHWTCPVLIRQFQEFSPLVALPQASKFQKHPKGHRFPISDLNPLTSMRGGICHCDLLLSNSFLCYSLLLRSSTSFYFVGAQASCPCLNGPKGWMFLLQNFTLFVKELCAIQLASASLWMYMETWSCSLVQVEASHYLHFIHKNGPH